MRKPTYLSPTSLSMFYERRDDFYIQYISDYQRPRPPQTAPMAVGSAFDAYVKSYLVETLIGKDPRFAFETIFEAQVEAHNRVEARHAGKIVFDAYTSQGALSDILLDLKQCVGKPRFEEKIEGFVTGVSVTKGEVPLHGRPDIFFLSPQGARVIFDWKVNGYYAAQDVSPSPGYVRIRTNDAKNGMAHPKAQVTLHNGVRVSVMHPMCMVDKKWAAQLSIYAWLLGQEIGSKFIVAIDQIACGRKEACKTFRVAQHRSIVTESFQKDLFQKAITAWDAIQRGHIFFEMSRTDSDNHCRLLDDMASVPVDAAFEALCR